MVMHIRRHMKVSDNEQNSSADSNVKKPSFTKRQQKFRLNSGMLQMEMNISN